MPEAPADKDDEEALAFGGLLDQLLAAYDLDIDIGGAASADLPPAEAVEAHADSVPADVDSHVPAAPASSLGAPPIAGKRKPRHVVGGEIKVPFCGGFVVYYHSNQNFEAQCMDHPEERCTLTKKSGAAADSSTATLRRPLGFLAAWLVMGCICLDTSEHKQTKDAQGSCQSIGAGV